MEETVTISKKEYELLKEKEVWLQCLEGAGVDNWQGFEDACDLLATVIGEKALKEEQG